MNEPTTTQYIQYTTQGQVVSLHSSKRVAGIGFNRGQIDNIYKLQVNPEGGLHRFYTSKSG